MATSTAVCILLMASILMDTSGTFAFRIKKRPGSSSRGHFEGGRKWRRDSSPFTPKAMKVADNITFMEFYPDYPEKLLMGILKKEGKDHKDVFGKDYQELTLHPRLGAETVLCPSWEKIVYPKVGLNKDNDWKYIVNVGEEYVQGVFVETCDQSRDVCAFSDNFPSGYTSKCEQKFVFRKLLSVAEKGSTVLDEFRMPSCCSCAIKGPSES